MNVTRVFDLFEHIKEEYNKADVFGYKKQGVWQTYNIDQCIEITNLLSSGLLSLGLKKGDRIVSISNNRPEWNFIDFGMSQIGVVHVPVYPTISNDDFHYIFNHAAPKCIFVSEQSVFDKIEPVAKQCGISDIFSFDGLNGTVNWNYILDLGRTHIDEHKAEIKLLKDSILPSDVFTIIYTSGTTGLSKGVMLSHDNFVQNVKNSVHIHDVDHHCRSLSFLPLSHVYERMLNYHYQYKGIGIYYAENFGTIADNLKEVQPHIFCTVPRILELFYEKIASKGYELGFASRLLFFWAIHFGKKYEVMKKKTLITRLKRRIADKLVYEKIRMSLGGNLRIVVSGGASLQTSLARLFWAAGIQLLEGYGLTETSPVISVNRLLPKLETYPGTVGKVLDGVEVKIALDGEILCRGHNIMLGYYKQPELTAEAIDKNGWFHTGDIGSYTPEGFLKITDRKKEIFKLSSGKYIAPQVIETKLKELEYIEQAIVIGENEKFASALVVPNFYHLHKWSSQHHIIFRDNEELIRNPEINKLYQKLVANINLQLGQVEQIKRFRLVHQEWTPHTGELSATLKLKRRVILEKYSDIIEQIYSSAKN